MATKAKAKARTQPRKRRNTHGGRRAGAGRKPIADGGTMVCTVTLTNTQTAKIERWQQRRGVDNFSAAVREMIDVADSFTVLQAADALPAAQAAQ